MIFFFVLLLLVLIAQIAEFFIPALPWLYNAHVYIVPMIVFYGAMALPFPLMLSLALFAGVLLDALTVQVIGGKVEISTGSSILIYGVLAGIMHDIRVILNPGVLKRLKEEDEDLLVELERRYAGRLTFRGDPTFHHEKFTITDANTGAELHP